MTEPEARPAETPVAPAPVAGSLQILATEHWSLLATRSLTYTESFSRLSTLLSLISGTTVALALFAQVDHFGLAFRLVAIPILAVLLLTGLSTFVRLGELNRDDVQWVMGMNRLRRAYVDSHPEIERYLVTSPNDDSAGILKTMNLAAPGGRVMRVLHGLSTLPVLVAIIDGVIAGALAGVICAAVGLPATASIVMAIASGLIVVVGLAVLARRAIRRLSALRQPFSPTQPH
jgi:hypothetical protein